MNNRIRDDALCVLARPEQHSWLAVHNAIIDLRRNGKEGDEVLLRKYLDYPDAMVVSAVLYALIHVYECPDLLDLLLRFVEGDSRDNGEMPIQLQAVEGLSLFAREDSTALSKLLCVANNPETPEAPRATAWQRLAELFGVPWQRDFLDAMLWDPESDKSIAIREKVLAAAKARNGRPLPASINGPNRGPVQRN